MAIPLALARAGAAAGGSGKWIGRLAQGGNLLGIAKSTLPIIEEQMEVTVFGDHDAKKSDLYFLAMSLIWGQITRRNAVKLLPPAGSIILEYSLEENTVRAVVRLQTSYLDALVASATNPAARKFQVFDGPPNGPYKGGTFQWKSQLPFFPGTMTTGWEDKTILTRDPTYQNRAGTTLKTQAPAPPGDGATRTTAPIATNPSGGRFAYDPAYLVFSALSIPCSTAGMIRDNSGSAYPPVSPPVPKDGFTTGNTPARQLNV